MKKVTLKQVDAAELRALKARKECDTLTTQYIKDCRHTRHTKCEFAGEVWFVNCALCCKHISSSRDIEESK